ncbi:hypothetical protein Bbelb_096530 [Branchiostoma belcheri]|nr:hypothetical protein Bbelb_096530 [Branchiostoma belcheri]
MPALEKGFRKLSITLGLMYLVNLALVIYITGESSTSQVSQPGPGHLYNSSRLPAQQPGRPTAEPGRGKPDRPEGGSAVSSVPRRRVGRDRGDLAATRGDLAATRGGTEETWQQPGGGETWQHPGKTWQQPGGVSGKTWKQPGTGKTWQQPGETWGRPGGWETGEAAKWTRPDQLGSDASRDPPTTQNSLEDPRFRTATFTTLGATGRAGPTSLDAHYRGQDHEKLVTLQDGIQLFNVPETGDYRIEVAVSRFRVSMKVPYSLDKCCGRSGQSDCDKCDGFFTVTGAAGGVDSQTPNASARGHGAWMGGTFHLTKGEELKVLVGQEGAETAAGLSAGGGGGTFVTRFNNTPLIIAGGGGGIAWLDRRYVSCDGTTLASGQTSYKGAMLRAGNSNDDGRQFAHWSGTSGGEGGYAFVNGGREGGRCIIRHRGGSEEGAGPTEGVRGRVEEGGTPEGGGDPWDIASAEEGEGPSMPGQTQEAGMEPTRGLVMLSSNC